MNPRRHLVSCFLFPLWLASLSIPVQAAAPWSNTLAALPARTAAPTKVTGDWLIDSSPFRAGVYRGAAPHQLVLANGLLARTFLLSPNAACIGLDQLTSGEAILRGVKPEASVEIDGQRYDVGGLKGQPNYAFLRADWLGQLQAEPRSFQFTGFSVGQPAERLAWKQVRHHAPHVAWPPQGVSLRLDFAWPESVEGPRGVTVSVHYELYDGLPCYAKWITVSNASTKTIRLDRYSSDLLAAVERVSEVDELSAGRIPPSIHVETEMAFGGMMSSGANRRSYRWLPDPDYQTQVNYERKTPCLLDVGPDLGPAQSVAPGSTFESYRAFVLPYDSADRERQGLSLRRLYRVLTPWATENPLMMHVRFADDKTVTNAIQQCAEVGFEMLILTFGSGFDLEDEKPATLEKAKRFSSWARAKGLEIGSYSLLASRHVGGGHDVVMPAGQTPTFGNSPCLVSQWGTNYFRRLYEFHQQSGFMLLEHDGSYPGDFCLSEKHPGHTGQADSRWNQWREISEFYKWCRAQGIYLNVPDHYFVTGSSKTGMGYRESNWSLPRAQQIIHTRQNIFDGTWEKLPSMGWMFVPLTEYQGGGEAATIEPLDQHLDHYERMLFSNLALGVQACYRGPRLYDTDRTKVMVKKWVAWYKAHRDILESDLIHGRRADGRDLDWMLHVNPRLKEKGLLVVFNPLDTEVEKPLRVNLYYTGLTKTARVTDAAGHHHNVRLERDFSAQWNVRVPAQGMGWWVIE